MRLVDDHPAEPEFAEPPDVPVEDLVVDDDDVGERVDVLTVAVQHGRAALRGPQLDLVRPVGLDDVRDDDEQRVRVGRLRREQRLRGLAEARLVGQQERAVTACGGRDDLRLVAHELLAARHEAGRRLRQRHACGRARRGLLERPEQRLEQLPAGETARAGRGALRRRLEVGGQERVREPAGDHRLRDDALLLGRGLRRRGRGLGLVGRLDAAGA